MVSNAVISWTVQTGNEIYVEITSQAGQGPLWKGRHCEKTKYEK